MSATKPNRLVFRLTSLGDVIVASAILRDGVRTDWVCALEYAPLLQGHPTIGQVIPFARASGFVAWLRLCWRLAREGGYTEVVDLHGSLRTRVARAVWLLAGSAARWRKVSKQRLRRLLYSAFKSAWPKAWRPTLSLDRARAFAVGDPTRGTDLTHLVTSRSGEPYFAVMPASKWASKQWPAPLFAEAIQRLTRELGGKARFVILGLASDRASDDLYRECERRGIAGEGKSVTRASGSSSFSELASLLASARGYIGMDTGLAHLAESVGTDAFMIFGPSTPDFGFGPWRAGSRATGQALWCRPCSKDGRACFRVSRRYACLAELEPASVLPELTEWAQKKMAANQ